MGCNEGSIRGLRVSVCMYVLYEPELQDVRGRGQYERRETLRKPLQVTLELALVLALVATDQVLVLLQCVVTPAQRSLLLRFSILQVNRMKKKKVKNANTTSLAMNKIVLFVGQTCCIISLEVYFWNAPNLSMKFHLRCYFQEKGTSGWSQFCD